MIGVKIVIVGCLKKMEWECHVSTTDQTKQKAARGSFSLLCLFLASYYSSPQP